MRNRNSKFLVIASLLTCLGISGVASADSRPNLRAGYIGYDRTTHELSVEVISDGGAPVTIKTVLLLTIDGVPRSYEIDPVYQIPSNVFTIPDVYLTYGWVTASVDATFRVIESNEFDNVFTAYLIP